MGEGQQGGVRLHQRPLRFRGYEVRLDTVFDTSDSQSALEDTLAVYLLDPLNKSHTLLDRGTVGTTLFALSGEKADFLPGLVRWDGSLLTIDLSSVAPTQTGLLRFQLLQSDTDSGASAILIVFRAEAEALEKGDYQTIRVVFESYFQLTSLVGDKNTTIARLRKLERRSTIISASGHSKRPSNTARTRCSTRPAMARVWATCS